MESHPLYRYSETGAGLSFTSSHPTVPSLPNRLFGHSKFEIRESPISPFSTNFDCETLTVLSDNQEQYSSTDNYSGVSSSYNSSLETTSGFQRSSPSQDGCRDSLLSCSGRPTSLQNEHHSQNTAYTLQELEDVLMDDGQEVRVTDTSIGEHVWDQNPHGSQFSCPEDSVAFIQSQSGKSVHAEKHKEAIEELLVQDVPPGDLKQLLIACAKSLSDNDMHKFEKLIEKARRAVSISGEPIQRLGAYMIEGLVARKEESGSNIYHTLRCREPEGKDLLSYMHILYEICPYLKFGYMAANGAIAEACKNEDRIHIIDFQIAQGTQWTTLLQALAARPSGPPYVRITGIDDPVNRYARGAGLEAVAGRLAVISEKFKIPVEFNGLPEFAPDVTRDMLDVRPGEALAVNFPLQLHHTPDESVDITNPRDGLLRMVKSLSPKVITLIEQESNTNTTPFLTRFVETLDYYLAMFESIDVTLPRDRKERINVEQHCLARDIVNIIACEGKERVERHELFGKWKSRLTMAGFRQYPLSSYVNSVIRNLLRYYSENYTLVEKDGGMLLGWKDRFLVSASAWY